MTTTISVDESTKERFDRNKSELDDIQDAPDHTADSFLKALLDTWERDAHEVDVDRFELREDEVLVVCPFPDTAHEIADKIQDGMGGDSGMDYDDVKNACAAALREELPEGGRA